MNADPVLQMALDLALFSQRVRRQRRLPHSLRQEVQRIAAREAAGMSRGGHGLAAKVVLIELQWQRLSAAGPLRGTQFSGLQQWLTRYGVGKPELLASPSADAAIELLGRWIRRPRAEEVSHG